MNKQMTVEKIDKADAKERSLLAKVISNNPLEDIGLYKKGKKQGPQNYKKIPLSQSVVPAGGDVIAKFNTSKQFVDVKRSGLKGTAVFESANTQDLLPKLFFSNILQIVAGYKLSINGTNISSRSTAALLALNYESSMYENYKYLLPNHAYASTETGAAALPSATKALLQTMTPIRRLEVEFFIPLAVSHVEFQDCQNDALYLSNTSSVELMYKVGNPWCCSFVAASNGAAGNIAADSNGVILKELKNLALEYYENELQPEQLKTLEVNTYIQSFTNIQEISKPMSTSISYEFSMENKNTYDYLLLCVVQAGSDIRTSSVGFASTELYVGYDSYADFYKQDAGKFLCKKNAACLPFELGTISIVMSGQHTRTYDSAIQGMYQRMDKKKYIETLDDELCRYIVKLPLHELPFNDIDGQIVPGAEGEGTMTVIVQLKKQNSSPSVNIAGNSPDFTAADSNDLQLACLLVGKKSFKMERGIWMTM